MGSRCEGSAGCGSAAVSSRHVDSRHHTGTSHNGPHSLSPSPPSPPPPTHSLPILHLGWIEPVLGRSSLCGTGQSHQCPGVLARPPSERGPLTIFKLCSLMEFRNINY